MAQPTAEGRVLFAYDGSDLAKNAIREAAAQLSPGRRGIVLTVWEPLASHPFAGSAAAWGIGLEDDLRVEADKMAEEGRGWRTRSASTQRRSRRAVLPSGRRS